jgi:methyl-accepting chemotaxis protein
MSQKGQSFLPSFVEESYAVRLGVALSFAIVVMVCFGLVISTQATGTLEDDVETDLTGDAETQASELESWVENTERSVRATSASAELDADDPTATSDYLETLVETDRVSTDVAAVHYVDTEQSRIVASSNESFVGVNPADQGAPFATNPPEFSGPHDTHVTEPFTVLIADHPIIAVLSPVPGDENGVLVYMTDLQERAQTIGDQQSDTYTVVVNDGGQFVAHPNTSMILTDHREMGMLDSLSPGESSFMEMNEEVMGLSRMGVNGWTVMVHSDKEAAFALANQINSDLIGLLLLAVINLGLVGVTVGTNTITSLRRISERAREMGEGNLDVDLSTSRGDEIGTLYDSFDQMRTSLRESIEDAEQAREEAERAREEAIEEREAVQEVNEELERKVTEYRDVLSDAAAGDLTRRVDPESGNESMQVVGEEINSTLDALEEIISTTQSFAQSVLAASEQAGSNADQVESASRDVRDSIQEIFESASRQNQQLQDAANDMEGLSATAEEVAASAQQVADTSQAAAEVGETGREAAREAIEKMNAIDAETDETVSEITELAEDLDEIGEIVDLITEIVEQTNMLALNASIEAAHADADGDGFAVVADEIKNLAEETKDAAGDIETRIERIQSQAGETVETMEATSERITTGTETVEEAIEALERIVEYTEEVDVGIQEIDDATAEQADAAQSVMGVIDELTEISQQTASEADRVANAAEAQTESIDEVSTSADDLRENARALQDLLDRFTVKSDAAGTGAAGGSDAFDQSSAASMGGDE